jgi:adenine deaminase
MAALPEATMLADIMPYDGALAHGDRMLEKVVYFVKSHTLSGHEPDRRGGQ